MPRPLHFVGYPRARFAGPPRPRRVLASGQYPRTRSGAARILDCRADLGYRQQA